MYGPQIGENRFNLKSSDELRQIEQVSAYVADGTEFTALLGKDAPVEIGGQKQPVLLVAAVQVEDLAQFPALDQRPGMEHARIESDVVVHRANKMRMGGRRRY